MVTEFGATTLLLVAEALDRHRTLALSQIRCSSFGGLSCPSSGQWNASIFENAEFDEFVV